MGLAHDSVVGDRVEVFLRADHVWMLVGDALKHLQCVSGPSAAAELEDRRAVHACLDPYGMPDAPEGPPVWQVPPEPMWRLVTRCAQHTAHPHRWLREARDTTRRVLIADFPDIARHAARGEDDDDQAGAP